MEALTAVSIASLTIYDMCKGPRLNCILQKLVLIFWAKLDI